MNRPGQPPRIQGIQVSYKKGVNSQNSQTPGTLRGESATLETSRTRRPLKIHRKKIQKTDLFPKVSSKIVNRMRR